MVGLMSELGYKDVYWFIDLEHEINFREGKKKIKNSIPERSGGKVAVSTTGSRDMLQKIVLNGKFRSKAYHIK